MKLRRNAKSHKENGTRRCDQAQRSNRSQEISQESNSHGKAWEKLPREDRGEQRACFPGSRIKQHGGQWIPIDRAIKRLSWWGRTDGGGGGLGGGWRVKDRKHKENMALPEKRLLVGRRQGRSGDKCEVQGCLGWHRNLISINSVEKLLVEELMDLDTEESGSAGVRSYSQLSLA